MLVSSSVHGAAPPLAVNDAFRHLHTIRYGAYRPRLLLVNGSSLTIKCNQFIISITRVHQRFREKRKKKERHLNAFFKSTHPRSLTRKNLTIIIPISLICKWAENWNKITEITKKKKERENLTHGFPRTETWSGKAIACTLLSRTRHKPPPQRRTWGGYATRGGEGRKLGGVTARWTVGVDWARPTSESRTQRVL